MNAIGERVATGASAVLLVPQGLRAVITNRDATNSVSLGGPTVAAGAGYQLKSGETINVDAVSDDVWVIADAGTPSVHVLMTRAMS